MFSMSFIPIGFMASLNFGNVIAKAEGGSLFMRVTVKSFQGSAGSLAAMAAEAANAPAKNTAFNLCIIF